MKPCPYCAEQIQDAAAKCRFCGEWLDPSKRPDYAEAGTTSAQLPAPEVPAPTFNPPARSVAPAAVPTPAAWSPVPATSSPVQHRATDTPAPTMGVESPVLGGFEPPPPRAAAPARTEVAPAPAPARPAGPAAQSWSPPAWLAHEELAETPARTGHTVVTEPSRASLEEVALRMQRIKASAAAVRQAVQEEARRRPPTQPPMPAARSIAPPPADPMDDDPAEAATMVDGPRLDANIDRPRRLAEVPRHEPLVPPTSTASGAFDAMPSKSGFEDGFLGDLEGDEEDEFGDDEFGDDEDGDFGDAGDFGDVRASRPLPWKPIVVGAVVVLGIGLVAFWGRIFPDEAATQTTSDEQKADEDAATDEVAKSSVAPEKPGKNAAEDPVPGEGQPVVPEGETPAAVGAAPEGEPNPATAAGAVDPAAGSAPAGTTPTGATPAGATPVAGATPTPAGATPAAGATPMPAGAPLDPAMLQQLEEARAHYRKGGKKRLKDAQALLQTILSRAPMHPDALLVMAQVQLELGLPEDSLATATTCTQVAPEMADCWLTIGVLEQERKHGSTAADAYARYLELAPDGAYAGQVSKQLKRLRK